MSRAPTRLPVPESTSNLYQWLSVGAFTIIDHVKLTELGPVATYCNVAETFLFEMLGTVNVLGPLAPVLTTTGDSLIETPNVLAIE